MNAKTWDQPLLRAVLEITNACNLRCPHCASNSGKPRPNELTGEQWCDVITQLVELGCIEITLIGGEVFLHPQWLEVAQFIREAGVDLIVVTNGLSLGEQEEADLIKLQPLLVGVSIDGPDPSRYQAIRGVDGFDRALSLCHRLLAAGVSNVNAITTFTRKNLPWWDDFVSLFDGGVVTWQVQLANKGGSRWDEGLFLRPEDFEHFIMKAKESLDRKPNLPLRFMDDFGYFPLDPSLAFLHEVWQGCMAGREIVGIRSDGFVSPCLSLGDRFLVGPLSKRSLRDIWQDPKSFAALRNPLPLGGDCEKCPHGIICRGGCSAIALSACGRLGENTHCIRIFEEKKLQCSLWGE